MGGIGSLGCQVMFLQCAYSIVIILLHRAVKNLYTKITKIILTHIRGEIFSLLLFLLVKKSYMRYIYTNTENIQTRSILL